MLLAHVTGYNYLNNVSGTVQVTSILGKQTKYIVPKIQNCISTFYVLRPHLGLPKSGFISGMVY